RRAPPDAHGARRRLHARERGARGFALGEPSRDAAAEPRRDAPRCGHGALAHRGAPGRAGRRAHLRRLGATPVRPEPLERRAPRAYYLTFNPAWAGDYRAEYYARKRECFPPEYEREPGVDYAARGRQFNLGNPFD